MIGTTPRVIKVPKGAVFIRDNTLRQENGREGQILQFVLLSTKCRRAGLGTTFFSVLNASFFCVLLKNAMFF